MKISERMYQAIIAALLLLIVIWGGWWVWCKKNNAGPFKSTTTSSSTKDSSSGNGSLSSSATNPSATVGGEAVLAGDQPAGSFVSVSSATLSQTGWVAVRDSGGRVLGAARLDAGVHEAVQIPLLRNTVSGEHYQVLLYTDDGDKEFDLHKDALVMNSDGSIAGAAFTALRGD